MRLGAWQSPTYLSALRFGGRRPVDQNLCHTSFYLASCIIYFSILLSNCDKYFIRPTIYVLFDCDFATKWGIFIFYCIHQKPWIYFWVWLRSEGVQPIFIGLDLGKGVMLRCSQTYQFPNESIKCFEVAMSSLWLQYFVHFKSDHNTVRWWTM